MKKDIEWLKKEIWKQDIIMDKGYIYTDDLMSIINEVDEPEVLSQELPVIPKYVAEYLDFAKSDVSLMRVLEIANRRDELSKWEKEYDWISANDEKFARAWLDGYEIEKEKLRCGGGGMIPKFRGFRTKTEEWVEGNLIYREEPYQHDIVTPIGNCSTISYAVERDSIGQWTGLRDKNSVEIYEGDILKNGRGEIGQVVYLQQEAGFVVSLKIRDYRLGHRNTGEGYRIASDHTIVGNVYENPELLEVSE